MANRCVFLIAISFSSLLPAALPVVIEAAAEGEHTHIVDVDDVSTLKFDRKQAA